MEQKNQYPTQQKLIFETIGFVHSEHKQVDSIPVQPVYANGCHGRAEILPEYEKGLCDLEGFSHIYLIYYFHQAGSAQLIVRPFLEDRTHGVFSTRSPRRPNPIGLSLVRLLKRQQNILYLDDVDILDGTPIIDIKPYISRFDHRENTRDGWQEEVDEDTASRRGARGYKKKDK